MHAFGKFLSGESDISVFHQSIEKDFLYVDANSLLIFIDNHDVLRAAYLSGGINKKLEIALNILFTTRGIPQIYYGTEIGIKGGSDHGDIRADFPGGFKGDSINAFKKYGRNRDQLKIFKITKELIEIRKSEPSLQYGSLNHFMVKDSTYVYNRSYLEEVIYIFVNNKKIKKELNLCDYKITLRQPKNLKKDFSFSHIIDQQKIILNPQSVSIIKSGK
jgi:glycosidase